MFEKHILNINPKIEITKEKKKFRQLEQKKMT